MTNEADAPQHHTEVFCPDDWGGPIAAQAACRTRLTDYESVGGWDTLTDSYEDGSHQLTGYMFQAWPTGTERPKTPPMVEAMRIGPSGIVEAEPPPPKMNVEFMNDQSAIGVAASEPVHTPTPEELLHEEAVELIVASEHNPAAIMKIFETPKYASIRDLLVSQFPQNTNLPTITISGPLQAPMLEDTVRPDMRPAEASVPTIDTTYVDNSIISAQAACSTQAWMRYAMHYTSIEENLYFEAGTATHIMLENYFRGVPAPECLVLFDDYYKEWADAKISTLPDQDDGKEHRTKRLTHANVRKILEQWLEVHPLDRLPFTTQPDYVEIGFQYPLNDEGDLVLVGRIDAIVRNLENTAWRILDWKTTGQIGYQFMDRINYGSQMTGYVEGAQVCFPEPVEGAMIGAIELGKLPESNRKCEKHGVAFAECSALHAKFQFIGPIIRSEAEIAAWKQCATSLAKKFRETRDTYTEVEHVKLLRMQGRFNGSCGFCTFRDWCDVGRPTEPQFLNGMLRIEKWEPFEGAFGERKKPEVKADE